MTEGEGGNQKEGKLMGGEIWRNKVILVVLFVRVKL